MHRHALMLFWYLINYPGLRSYPIPITNAGHNKQLQGFLHQTEWKSYACLKISFFLCTDHAVVKSTEFAYSLENKQRCDESLFVAKYSEQFEKPLFQTYRTHAFTPCLCLSLMKWSPMCWSHFLANGFKSRKKLLYFGFAKQGGRNWKTKTLKKKWQGMQQMKWSLADFFISEKEASFIILVLCLLLQAWCHRRMTGLRKPFQLSTNHGHVATFVMNNAVLSSRWQKHEETFPTINSE